MSDTSTDTSSEHDQILYEVIDERIAVVTLNRPHKANSQTPALLDDLNDAMMRAAADREVRVIVRQANGKRFSAGHDLSGEGRRPEDAIDLKVDGLSGVYEWETKRYIGYSRAWRDIRKPTIAAVQGKCIAGGLLLCWPMDIIIAADDAKFSDPVVRLRRAGHRRRQHRLPLSRRQLAFPGALAPARHQWRTEPDRLQISFGRPVAEPVGVAAVSRQDRAA